MIARGRERSGRAVEIDARVLPLSGAAVTDMEATILAGLPADSARAWREVRVRAWTEARHGR